MSNVTFRIPDIHGGCWADSETAVAICCSQFGGSRLNLTDSPIAGCAYNQSSGFIEDDPNSQSTRNSSSTTSLWATCINLHVNFSDIPPEANNATVSTCTPSEASKNSNSGRAMYEIEGQFGRVFVFGVVAGSSSLYIAQRLILYLAPSVSPQLLQTELRCTLLSPSNGDFTRSHTSSSSTGPFTGSCDYPLILVTRLLHPKSQLGKGGVRVGRAVWPNFRT
ncbi:hypothetical protein B0H19DRAFT_1073077 [Mycena capillaripes]|nr:hypothetical protein B0H19DRAFT_1073077 [Mycena capillaripes]